MKKYALLVIILILGILRFLWIDRFPVGMSNDEVEYATSAKSYALSNRDVSGFSFPLSLFKTETDGAISPIPPLIISLPLKIMPMNQTTIRIIYVIVNLLTAYCLYLLVSTLFRKKVFGLVAVILFLINPWSIYLSREAQDAPFALLFYIAGITTLLRFKGWKLVIPFLFFALAFFSYHGGKFIFLPVILICLIYKSWSDKTKFFKSKSILGFIAASVIFIFLYFFISYRIPGSTLFSRSGDLFFTDNVKITSIVNDERRQAVENPFKAIFSNKATTILKTFPSQYLTTFSTDVLFIGGDLRATYRFGEHGLLYLIDIPLLLAGILGLYKKDRGIFIFLLSLALIAPIATAVSGVEISVINRSFLLLPILMIFSTYGVMEILSWFAKKELRLIAVSVLVLIMCASAAIFYYFYFFSFPVLAQENYWLSESVLHKYLSWSKADQQIEILTDRPRSSFLRYILLSDKKVQNKILKNLYPYSGSQIDYQTDNTIFSETCPSRLDKNTLYAISTKLGCTILQKPDFSIIDQKDAGTLINIYNSSICKGISDEKWRRFSYISDYSFEKMDYNNFCSRWISVPE